MESADARHPAYLACTTGEVSTDSFYWVSRMIAAMADAHYLIEKAVSNGATVSKIRRLDTAETVDELSRMLGGVEITDKVRESAREMKELAAKKKK